MRLHWFEDDLDNRMVSKRFLQWLFPGEEGCILPDIHMTFDFYNSLHR